MPKEKPASQSESFDLIRILAPQTKMRKVLEIFDLGSDKGKSKERKNKFIELLGQYHQSSKSSQKSEVGSSITYNEISDTNRKALHDKIMGIIRSISLSVGLTKEQELLTEYLSRDRKEVEKMIGTYFLGYNPSDPREQSELKQAMRGEGYFTSPPEKENK